MERQESSYQVAHHRLPQTAIFTKMSRVEMFVSNALFTVKVS
jgi:hypothetical protein